MAFKSYDLRSARVTVTVNRPDANGNAADQTYRFQEHRMRINVRQAGAQFGNAHIQIYGVPLDTMNQIARLWLEVLTPLGTDTVAIDVWDGQDYVPFFSGVIMWSAVNAAAMPDVALDIEANSSGALMIKAVPPYAAKGPIRLQDALTAIAKAGGFSVVYPDSAPQYQLTNARATGSALEQIATLMSMYPDLTWSPSTLQQIVVRPALAPLGGDPIRVAPDTGLMGYPVYSTSSLQLATLFNPKITPGAGLNVVTDFDYVNRTVWVAAVLAHSLEPNVPGGQWTTQIAANPFGTKGNGTSS